MGRFTVTVNSQRWYILRANGALVISLTGVCMDHRHHHHHLSLNRDGRRGTTEDFTISLFHGDSGTRYSLGELTLLHFKHVEFIVEPFRPPGHTLRTLRTSAQ